MQIVSRGTPRWPTPLNLEKAKHRALGKRSVKGPLCTLGKSLREREGKPLSGKKFGVSRGSSLGLDHREEVPAEDRSGTRIGFLS